MNARTALTLLVGLLVVTTGCLGPGGADSQSTASGAATQSVAGTPPGDETPESNREADTDRGIATRHSETLRERGSVTVRSSTVRTTTNGDDTVTVRQERVSRISLADGRYLDSLDPLGGDPSVSYRTANGTVGSRLGSDGGYSYVGSTRARTINVTDRIRVPGVADGAPERRGTMTVDSVSGTVYVVEEFAAVRDIYEGIHSSDVTAFNMTYVVADGYVSYLRISVTATVDDRTVSQSSTTRYTGVGTTTFDRPAWVARALGESTTPEQ